jgi:endoglucanase
VRDGILANNNYGSATELSAKRTTASGFSRETYLMFDLGSVSTINSAVLRLFGKLSDTQQPTVQTSVFSLANKSATWSESSITWNTKPAASTTALATATIRGTAGAWVQWDLTSFLKSEKAAGRNKVTVVLRNPVSSGPQCLFNSDDAATNRPQIVVT